MAFGYSLHEKYFQPDIDGHDGMEPGTVMVGLRSDVNRLYNVIEKSHPL